jgi:hypothetical protein
MPSLEDPEGRSRPADPCNEIDSPMCNRPWRNVEASVVHRLRKRLSLTVGIVSGLLVATALAPVVAAQSLIPGISFQSPEAGQDSRRDGDVPQANTGSESSSTSTSSSASTGKPANDLQGRQTNRILGVIPNFQAVSADTYLPPLSFQQKFWLATRNTFDYSSFVFVGIQAGVEQATNTYPEFHQGGAAFGRYYWHIFADQTAGNFLTGALLPSLTHEDPRYYTLYHGGFIRRTTYAMSRVAITRNDKGRRTFNYSEILGIGATTGLGGFYYPQEERADLGETCERWAMQILTDAVGNVFEEFWPDINNKFFHQR